VKRIICVLAVIAVIATMFAGCTSSKAKDYTLKITYDSHYDGYSEEVYADYEKLYQAVINGDSTVSVNPENVDALNTLFYTGCPLSALVSSMSLTSSGDSIRLKYSQTQSAHKELVEKFTQETAEILYECGYEEKSDNELLLNLYTYISSNISQNEEITTAYDTIVDKTGSSSGYQAAFQFLVQQAGFKASRVYGVASTGARFLTEVIVDDEAYYFDPCEENNYSQGKGLCCFGMGALGLEMNGLGNDIKYSDNESVVFSEDSGKFNQLFQTVTYKYKDGTVTAEKKSGEIVEIAL